MSRLTAGRVRLCHFPSPNPAGLTPEGIRAEKLPRVPHMFAESGFEVRDHLLDFIVISGNGLAAQFVNSSFKSHEGTRPISTITANKMAELRFSFDTGITAERSKILPDYLIRLSNKFIVGYQLETKRSSIRATNPCAWAMHRLADFLS